MKRKMIIAIAEALVQGEAVHGLCYYSVIYLEGSKIAYCGTCTEIPGTTNDINYTGYCN